MSANANPGYLFEQWKSEDISLESNQVNSATIKIVMPEKCKYRSNICEKK